jgi:hypothetical protein
MRTTTPNRSRPSSPTPATRQVAGAEPTGDTERQSVNVYLRIRNTTGDACVVSTREATGSSTSKRLLPRVLCEVSAPYRGRFTFPFDGCVAPGTSGGAEEQRLLFELAGRSLIENAFRGFNAALVAYGQTGSGKTHSVFGPRLSFGTDMEGLVPRVCRALFGRAEVLSALHGAKTFVTASLLEVYLDDVFDLLQNRRQLRVRQNVSGVDSGNVTFSVAEGRAVEVQSYGDIATVLQDAEPLRTVAPTAVHDRSSRAHTLFELRIITDYPDGTRLSSKLVIADLAGSERVREAKTESGVAFEQACSINKSLLALGSCVEAAAHSRLGEFRTSTLTKLLKEFIGGSSVTSVLITVSPDAKDVSATLQTLRFSERLKFVRSAARQNKSLTLAQPAAGEEASEHPSTTSGHHREDIQQRKDLLEAELTLELAIKNLCSARMEIVEDSGSAVEDVALPDFDRELEELHHQLREIRAQTPVGKMLLSAEADLDSARRRAALAESHASRADGEIGDLRERLSQSQSHCRDLELRLANHEQKFHRVVRLLSNSGLAQNQYVLEVFQDFVSACFAKSTLALEICATEADHMRGLTIALRDDVEELRQQLAKSQRRCLLLEADRRVQAENGQRERMQLEAQHKANIAALTEQHEASGLAVEAFFKQKLAQQSAETDTIVRQCAIAHRALAVIAANYRPDEIDSSSFVFDSAQPHVLQPRMLNPRVVTAAKTSSDESYELMLHNPTSGHY